MSDPKLTPTVAPGPGVFDLLQVEAYGRSATRAADSFGRTLARLHPDDIEAIARRVAELLRVP